MPGILFAHVFTFASEYRCDFIFHWYGPLPLPPPSSTPAPSTTITHSLGFSFSHSPFSRTVTHLRSGPTTLDSLWKPKNKSLLKSDCLSTIWPRITLENANIQRAKNLSSVWIWCDNKHRYYCHCILHRLVVIDRTATYTHTHTVPFAYTSACCGCDVFDARFSTAQTTIPLWWHFMIIILLWFFFSLFLFGPCEAFPSFLLLPYEFNVGI